MITPRFFFTIFTIADAIDAAPPELTTLKTIRVIRAIRLLIRDIKKQKSLQKNEGIQFYKAVDR